jgi:hypothetical protein
LSALERTAEDASHGALARGGALTDNRSRARAASGDDIAFLRVPYRRSRGPTPALSPTVVSTVNTSHAIDSAAGGRTGLATKGLAILKAESHAIT